LPFDRRGTPAGVPRPLFLGLDALNRGPRDQVFALVLTTIQLVMSIYIGLVCAPASTGDRAIIRLLEILS
jgi:hypothetical protein